MVPVSNDTLLRVVVSMVVRQYDVNANQVFSWRKRYREAVRRGWASLDCAGAAAAGAVAAGVLHDPLGSGSC
jgi:transposase-like protein